MKQHKMWESQSTWPKPDRLQHFRLVRSGETKEVLTYREVIELWQADIEFVQFYSNLLATSPFVGYRWETPAVTTGTLNREFEFVLLKCDGLERPVDRKAFASHFNDQPVVTFPNLSGDASMVVPCPNDSPEIYGHLASFLRNAPKAQVNALWQAVGLAMENRVSEKPVWLSTAGMGVSWLHVRLDSRPKYYGHAEYK